MRVEFLTSTPTTALEGSGTFVAIDGLVRGLRATGHTVGVRALSLRTGFHTFDRFRYNAAVAVVPPRADLVVGVDLDGFLWAARRRRGGPRFVVALKGVIADELRNERGLVRALLTVQARWERRNTERADLVVVPSRYSAEVAADAYGIPRAKIAVVPEPIDLAAWQRLFAQAPPRPSSRPTVLAVARAYPRKRLIDLVEAAALLRGRLADVEVRIVGDGPESPWLRTRSAALGLTRTVTFLGEVSRSALAAEYARADCFCLPTVQEGFGLVFVEAMAAGLPVVAPRAAAVPEVVLDGLTGVLVSPRQPDELAAALARLLLDDALRKELGEAGRARAQTFDLAPVARGFLEACG